MHVCMYACMHACMFPPRSACLCAARRACAHAHPRLIDIAEIYFIRVCVLHGMYVRCRRVPHVRAMSARYSCSHAPPPFRNARSPVARS